jgi:hypothetical protein
MLPQWYWHPVMAVCTPDGREINPKWRHTHESFSVETVVDIMKQALAIAGKGIDAEVARKNRALLTEAEDALILQEYDKALRLARQVKKAVDRGRLPEDAARIEREAAFLAETKKMLDSLSPRAEASEPFLALLDALNYCLIRDYPEALNLFEKLEAGSGEYTKTAAALRPEAKEILEGALEIVRVALGRFRIGPDIYHDIRSQVRCRLDGVEEIVLQYAVLLDDGTVYSAYEGHGEVEQGNNHRSSTFLPYQEIPSADRIVDLRVELWLGDRLVGVKHLRPEASSESWWKKETVRALLLDNGRTSTWNSKGFPKSKREGVRYKGTPTLANLETPADPVRQEIVEIFKILDWKRFTIESRVASYRLTCLGKKAAPHLAPLAYRYGAITTLQVIYPLARIPHPDSARAVIHNLAADDVTLVGPARRLVGWLEGQVFVPLDELLTYLESDSHGVQQWGAHTLGVVGKKEGFLPLVSFLRNAAPGSKTASVAVSALRTLTGIDFGIDPDVSLAEQSAAVKRMLAWWDESSDPLDGPCPRGDEVCPQGIPREGVRDGGRNSPGESDPKGPERRPGSWPARRSASRHGSRTSGRGAPRLRSIPHPGIQEPGARPDAKRPPGAHDPRPPRTSDRTARLRGQQRSQPGAPHHPHAPIRALPPLRKTNELRGMEEGAGSLAPLARGEPGEPALERGRRVVRNEEVGARQAGNSRIEEFLHS